MYKGFENFQPAQPGYGYASHQSQAPQPAEEPFGGMLGSALGGGGMGNLQQLIQQMLGGGNGPASTFQYPAGSLPALWQGAPGAGPSAF